MYPPKTGVLSISAIGAIAIVIGAFYIRRWWIHRQNSTLLRKYDEKIGEVR
jgi:hypothetical protein